MAADHQALVDAFASLLVNLPGVGVATIILAADEDQHRCKLRGALATADAAAQPAAEKSSRGVDLGGGAEYRAEHAEAVKGIAALRAHNPLTEAATALAAAARRQGVYITLKMSIDGRIDSSLESL